VSLSPPTVKRYIVDNLTSGDEYFVRETKVGKRVSRQYHVNERGFRKLLGLFGIVEEEESMDNGTAEWADDSMNVRETLKTINSKRWLNG